MFSDLSILAANSEFGYQRFEVKAGAMTLLGGGVANKVAVGKVLTFPFTLNSKYESQIYQVSVESDLPGKCSVASVGISTLGKYNYSKAIHADNVYVRSSVKDTNHMFSYEVVVACISVTVGYWYIFDYFYFQICGLKMAAFFIIISPCCCYSTLL